LGKIGGKKARQRGIGSLGRQLPAFGFAQMFDMLDSLADSRPPDQENRSAWSRNRTRPGSSRF
jgi:hypothetical protein